jgi:hypothetical protein
MDAIIRSGTKAVPTSCLAGLFGFLLLCAALPVSADVDLMYGDIDGFGFMSVEGLVDDNGLPSDRNMNGILDAGDVLPSGGGGQSPGTMLGIGVANGLDDWFSNRSGADPGQTDAGLNADRVLNIDFPPFTIPEGHVIKSAQFILVAGDLSRDNAASHVVLVDGQSSDQTLVPRELDGQITLSTIVIDKSLYPGLADGVRIGMDFNVSDDIAIDYARLYIKTGPDVVSLPFLPLLLE